MDQATLEPRLIPTSGAPSRARQFVAENDVVISGVRVYLRNIALVPKDVIDVASTAFCVLRPKPELDPAYLLHWVTSDIFISWLVALQRGNSPPAVLDADVRSQLIPMPETLHEQKRIASRIDALLEEVADGEVALRAAREATEIYRQALLKAANAGILTAGWRAANPGSETGEAFLERIAKSRSAKAGTGKGASRSALKIGSPPSDGLPPLPIGWVWTNLEQLASAPTRNGLSVKGVEGPTPVRGLRLDALVGNRVDWSRTRYLPRTRTEVSQYLLQDGDLLVSRANGSPRLVGKASICEAPPEDVIFPDTAFRFRLGGPPSLKDWVLAQWSSLLVRAQIVARAKTTAGILKVSQGDLRKVALPLPGQAEMEAALQLISEALSAADDASECIDAADAGTTLRQSILAAAFRGDFISESQA